MRMERLKKEDTLRRRCDYALPTSPYQEKNRLKTLKKISKVRGIYK